MPAKSLLVKDALDEIMATVKAELDPLGYGYQVKLEEGAQELPETLTIEFQDLDIENQRPNQDPATNPKPPISLYTLTFELELYGSKEKASNTKEKSLEFWEALERILHLPEALSELPREGHKYGRIYTLENSDGDDYAATRKNGIRKIKLALVCEARRRK